MPVRRRAGRPGVWQIDLRDIGGGRRDFRGSKAEAVEAERRQRAQLVGPQRDNVETLLARYWREHGQHVRSIRSERAYMTAWADALGDATPLSAVTGQLLAEVVAEWRSTPRQIANKRTAIVLSPGAINRRIACLQRAWRRAEDLWGWQLPRIAWGRLKLTEAEPRDRSVPHDVREAFMDALPDRSRLLFALAFATGLRKGALRRLTAADFDWHAGVLHAVSKGRGDGKLTDVPITDSVCAVIQALGRLPDGPIFPVTEQQLRRDIDAAERACGHRVTMHQGRHSFAQDLEDSGAGDVITAALHHSDPKLRMRYSRTRMARVADAIERMQSQQMAPNLAPPRRTKR